MSMSVMYQSLKWSKERVLRERLFPYIRQCCELNARRGADPTVRLTEAEMHKVTQCEEDECEEPNENDECPHGLYLTTKGAKREVLYDMREDEILAFDENLWFKGIYGKGIKWTTNSSIGSSWRSMEMQKRSRHIPQVSKWMISMGDENEKRIGRNLLDVYPTITMFLQKLQNGKPRLNGSSTLDNES